MLSSPTRGSRFPNHGAWNEVSNLADVDLSHHFKNPLDPRSWDSPLKPDARGVHGAEALHVWEECRRMLHQRMCQLHGTFHADTLSSHRRPYHFRDRTTGLMVFDLGMPNPGDTYFGRRIVISDPWQGRIGDSARDSQTRLSSL